MKDSKIDSVILGLVWSCGAKSDGHYVEEFRTNMKGKLDLCAIDLWRAEVTNLLIFINFYRIMEQVSIIV